MSLGKKSKFDDSNTKFYYVTFKSKNKDTGKSYFSVSTKGNDGKIAHLEDVFDLSGRLVKIEHKVTEWNGQKIENINYYLKDNDELYIVQFPFGIASRAMFNATLSLTSFEGLEIGTYMTKPKTPGAKTYPAITIRQNGEMVRWKFDLKDLPKVQEVKFKDQVMRDYSATDKFFVDHLLDLNNVISNSRTANVAENQVDDEDSVPQSNGKDDESIPF